MGKMDFKINREGIANMMKSAEMQSILTKKASAIKNRCGIGYESDIYIGKNRANAMVSAKTYQAKQDNLKNNTLLKAVR